MVKRISLIILIAGYLAAGINHFIRRHVYISIIPHYIPLPVFVNYLSGFFEILFGALLIFKTTRRFAALAIGFMLIAFLPVHIQMVIDAPFMPGTFTVTPLVAWLRLGLQPWLIWWAWWHAQEPL